MPYYGFERSKVKWKAQKVHGAAPATLPPMALPELHPIPVVSPWYQVGIDFIGPLQPPSTQGSRYILIINNYFTKYLLVVPTETKDASGVVDAPFKLPCISYV